MELTQEQLEEIDQGKPAPPRAVFYEKAKINVDRSKKVGHRVYDKMLYIRLSQPGVADNMSYLAQPEDIREYAEEYEYFSRNKQGTRIPGIEIIPNLDIAHLQELRDTGILNIQQLAEAAVVPPHLEYARQAAVMFNNVMKESGNAYEEERDEESPCASEELPAQNRPQHRADVQRPSVPASNGSGSLREAAERDGARRRSQRSEGVNWGSVRIV